MSTCGTTLLPLAADAADLVAVVTVLRREFQ